MNFRSAVAVKPGKIDRSPTGTALSAKMAILHRRGKMKAGETLTATSIIGSQFSGQILGKTKVGSFDAILPKLVDVHGLLALTSTCLILIRYQGVIAFQIHGVFKS